MFRIRVLLVDDHAMFRQGIRALLEDYEDIELVGEAAEGREALEKVHELDPQVVLMDIAMPTLGGLEAARRIQKETPKVRLIVLSQYEDSEYVLSFLRAGARGYVLKTASATELVSAIRAVHKGDSFLYPSAAMTLIREYLALAEGPQDAYDSLTDREREVIQLVAEGRTNQGIADLLCISVKTVLRHRTNIMEKLGFHNRTELIKYAISKGLIEMPRRNRSP